MFRFMLLLLGFAALAAGPVGCGTSDTHHERAQHSQDGTLGITEVNPNMPLSATYRTYQDDVRVIETTVRDRFPRVTQTSVTLNGPTARVRLYVPTGTSAEEAGRIQEEAKAALTQAMPRYRMVVTVSAK
ncbi:hypothetical protein O9H85_19655 [Paenibacillus filicis]|uniref:Sporulation protein n=1 Tax=Paenibacillus gyeongsangnamensis TaxID=3388067 RepID=A0ABT4QCI0_9BACL|nr:hypothetical protein [Paenibacillus filicis]MCZ8514599.1 hypothetical protein [Paenibacillus filicis]